MNESPSFEGLSPYCLLLLIQYHLASIKHECVITKMTVIHTAVEPSVLHRQQHGAHFLARLHTKLLQVITSNRKHWDVPLLDLICNCNSAKHQCCFHCIVN